RYLAPGGGPAPHVLPGLKKKTPRGAGAPAPGPTFPSLDDLDPVHSLRKIYWAVPFLPYTVYLYSHMEIAQ
ncbi:hypothetical protein ACUNF6_24315, partial [Serratia sp. IR-2025]